MSEEKIIYGVLSLMEALYNSMLHGTDCHLHLFNVPKYKEALQGLLDLYNKEKEKNREAIQYCKKDLAFKKRLEKAKDTIDNYNAGRFDTSESILNILEE